MGVFNHIPQVCEHRYVFLRQIDEKDGGYCPETSFYDVFFCEKCLKTSRMKAAHTISYGDGRREIRHDL